MIRHLLRLVWARKRSNLLLILEIFVSTLVLFAVFTMALIGLNRLLTPIGFNPENAYRISIDVGQLGDDSWASEAIEITHRLQQELLSLPGVVTVGGVYPPPYSQMTSSTTAQPDSNAAEVRTLQTYVTDEAREALQLNLVAGRWFDEQDAEVSYRPVVITQRFADELFPNEDPVDKEWGSEHVYKIIGVLDEYRKNGELSGLDNHMFQRVSLTSAKGRPIRNFIMRVESGTPVSIEEMVVKRMRAIYPDWTYRIAPVEADRDATNRLNVVPFVVVVMIGGFLMLMVVLGMLGVLWQSVTRRTDEIGLRRALGSPKDTVYHQILGEITLVTLFGCTLAVLLLLQLPLLGILGNIGWQTIIGALMLSLGFMVILALVSGLYPAWLAARVQPAQALHYE
ncbi:ABC transporter permease [bacterium]|nr:ABC transporter permease [bacterium]